MSIEIIFTSVSILAMVVFWFSPFEINVDEDADESFQKIFKDEQATS